MKYKLISIIILGIFFFSCCEKESKDIRDKYVGAWNFNVEISEVNTDSIGYLFDTTISYTGDISYGVSFDELEIKYTTENKINLVVNELGELDSFPTPYSNGAFEGSDTIHLYLHWGGSGGGITHIIDGNKK